MASLLNCYPPEVSSLSQRSHAFAKYISNAYWMSISRLSSKNISSKDAYAEFVIRTQEIAVKHGYVPVNWYVLALLSKFDKTRVLAKKIVGSWKVNLVFIWRRYKRILLKIISCGVTGRKLSSLFLND
jgi:hypothetical protein